MTWLAILLALASLGGKSGETAVRKYCAHAASAKQVKHCKAAKKQVRRTKPKRPVARTKPKRPGTRTKPPAPVATPAPSGGGSDPTAPPTTPGSTPTPAPTATPTPTATATPNPYPSRTGVDLTEWEITSSYHTLAAGRVVFNVANVGEDDHNLSVRGGGAELGRLDLAPGDADALVLTLAPGSYTLYCSLLGHEAAGMRAAIIVR